MSTGTESILSGLRQPEYTGENRCTPCTIVNVAIAVVASAIIGVVSPLLAPVVLGLFLTIIYLRGYLMPGTPELTKRYFPDRTLRWFDKTSTQEDAALIGDAGEENEIDPEPILRDGDVLEPTPDGTDLQLTEEFNAEWRKRIKVVRGSGYEPQLTRMLRTDEDVGPDAVEIRIDDRNATVFRDDTPVAMWTSETALIADMAAMSLLRERQPEWENMDVGVRGQLLHAVRVFLERCPTCDGDLALSEETVESCCRTAEVVTLICRECDTPVLEVGV